MAVTLCILIDYFKREREAMDLLPDILPIEYFVAIAI